VLFGVGVGGDRHALSWAAAGVPRRERGRRTDAALAVLPDLIRGKAADVGNGTVVRLAAGVPVPPIIVGGMAEPALARVATYGDDWFALPLPPAEIAPTITRLGEPAADLGRPAPAVTGSVSVAVEGDPALPDRDGLVRRLSDPDGMFGMPADAVPDILVTGGLGAVAERIDARGDLGAERVVFTLAAGTGAARPSSSPRRSHWSRTRLSP
jgi:alkanesulfonate monooxygenase SsuD/methylene tetrahydromethanopterin reductase-like flavin-dependent oxidoreductase (luciferase family)